MACEDFDYGDAAPESGADDAQYGGGDNGDGKFLLGEPLIIERVPEEVIIETIPDQKKLADTGGPGLVTIGVFVALGLVGFGVYLLRRM